MIRFLIFLFLFFPLSSSAMFFSGHLPALTPSGCVTVSSDNQVVQNLFITCAGDGITCASHPGVTIQNVIVYFSAGYGMNVNGCNNLTISNVTLLYTAAPPSGPLAADHYCINVYTGASLTIQNVLETNCQGIFVNALTGTINVSYLKSVNMRNGVSSYGTSFQCVTSTAVVTVTNFYFYNDLTIAATGDNLNFYGCGNAGNVISNGLIDGNTQYVGAGVVLESDTVPNKAYAAISNVDILHYCNDAVGVFDTTNVTLTNVRVRDSYINAGSKCADGVARSSNGAPFESYSALTTGTNYIGVQYFNIVDDSVLPIYDCPTHCGTIDVTQVNFTPMTPIVPNVP